tara:strand:+ start:184 stop:387 length:204 start_codon:yes stop_codon:yes gene_type:complete
MMGRRVRQDKKIRYFPKTEGNTKTYFVARIHDSCGAYTHYERQKITEVDGEVVKIEDLPDWHTLVRF